MNSKQLLTVVILCSIVTPMVAAAQALNFAIKPAINPTNTQTSTLTPTGPRIIGVGLDTTYNMVYMVFDKPIKRVGPSNYIDGVTLTVKGAPRALINGGAVYPSTLFTEIYVRPEGIPLKKSDPITISYTPGVTRVTDSLGNPSETLPVTQVLNGTDFDTTCPSLRSTILQKDNNQQALVIYGSEHFDPGIAWRVFSRQPGMVKINGQVANSYSAVTLASNMAILVDLPKISNWNGNLTVTADDSTNIVDLNGNKLCSGVYNIGPSAVETTDLPPTNQASLPNTTAAQVPIQPTVLPQPVQTTPVTTTHAKTPTPVTPTVAKSTPTTKTPGTTPVTSTQSDPNTPTTPAPNPSPKILSISNVEPAGTYGPGTLMHMIVNADMPLSSKSYAIIKLGTGDSAAGNKQVFVKPANDGDISMQGQYYVTNNMVSTKRVRAISGVLNLVSQADPTKITTSADAFMSDASFSGGNFGDKEFEFTDK